MNFECLDALLCASRLLLRDFVVSPIIHQFWRSGCFALKCFVCVVSPISEHFGPFSGQKMVILGSCFLYMILDHFGAH